MLEPACTFLFVFFRLISSPSRNTCWKFSVSPQNLPDLCVIHIKPGTYYINRINCFVETVVVCLLLFLFRLLCFKLDLVIYFMRCFKSFGFVLYYYQVCIHVVSDFSCVDFFPFECFRDPLASRRPDPARPGKIWFDLCFVSLLSFYWTFYSLDERYLQTSSYSVWYNIPGICMPRVASMCVLHITPFSLYPSTYSTLTAHTPRVPAASSYLIDTSSVERKKEAGCVFRWFAFFRADEVVACTWWLILFSCLEATSWWHGRPTNSAPHSSL